MGTHTGHRAFVSRGVHSMCRRPLPRWNDTYLSPSESLTQLGDWLGTVSPTGSVVTWVPGHDASRGPGYTVAVIAAETWDLPLIELVTRRQPLRSALASTVRPTLDQQLATLTSLQPGHCSEMSLSSTTRSAPAPRSSRPPRRSPL